MVPRASSPGMLSRAGHALVGVVTRLLGVGLPVFASSGGGIPVHAPYDVDASARAMGSNAWYYAAVHRIATDLSGLPLVVEIGEGPDRQQRTDHWLLRLLRRPGPKLSGLRLRRQLVADLKGGNAYLRVWRDAERSADFPFGKPVKLGRIPPQLIDALVGLDGEVTGWKLSDGRTLRYDEVLHIGDINLTAEPWLVLGAPATDPLALSLQVERDAKRHTGRAARRGRLEMMVSPRSDSMLLGKDRVEAITGSYAGATEKGDGIWVASVGMESQPLTLTPRDAEFSQVIDRTRAEVLAVMGTPETIVGSPAANYGTAREQSRIYWSGLQGLAALIDDELSRLAEDGVRLVHSFSGVDALQPSRTERQARAVIWADRFGLSPADAARYEGFTDLPTPSSAATSATPAAAPPSASGVQEPRKTTESSVVATLQIVASLFDAGESPEHIEAIARSLLATTLKGLGADPAAAATVAEEAAAVCAETARSVRDGRLVELRAFGSTHATRIARLAGLKEAA